MNRRHSLIKRKLMYGRPGVEAHQGNIDSTFNEFENSFSSTSSKRHPHQYGADKKWSRVGEGFLNHDIEESSAKHIHRNGSDDRKSRSTKRKISDISVVKDLKKKSKYSTEEETDELSANISCLTSDESETENISDITEYCKGNSSRTKSARCTGTAKSHTKQTTSNPSPKCLLPAAQDVAIKELTVEPGPSPVRAADDRGSGPPTPECVQEPADCISAYDSDTEDINSMPTSQVGSSQFQETCEDITVPSSTSPMVSPSQTGNKVKAGDWLKNIQWQDKTPTKSYSSCEPDNLEDSAKKKKKYSKCSMADQLSKLQSREKSAQIVWYHKIKEAKGQSTTATQSQECSKSLTMQVMSVEIRCSLCLTTCRQLTDGEYSTPSTVTVMFSQNSTNSQTVTKGAVVRMHPPWQTLDIPALGQNILLCSYYFIVNHCPSQSHKLNCDTNTVASFNAVWKCPCVQDCHIRSDRCPALTNLCPTSLSTFTPAGPSSTTKDVSSTSSNLHTVVDSQTPRGQLSESILDSLEKNGHSTGKGLSFQAVICRVFCKRHRKQPYLNWSMLVEDSHGVFALIQLPDHSNQLDNWKDVLSWEGLNIRLTGVTLLSRTNRDRDPSLFSVLDCVWRQNTHTTLDCSTDDSNSQLESVSRPCPGFCYLIKAWHERSGVKLLRNCSVTPGFKAEVKPHSLKEVWNSAVSQVDCDERWSFVCKVVYIEDASKNEVRPCHNCSHIIYVIDQSLMSNSTSSSPLHPLYVMQMCEVKDIQPSLSYILFVRDAHLHNGKLWCDEYSRVVKLSPPDLQGSSPLIPEGIQAECEVLKTMSFKHHHLTRDSVPRDLVTIRGNIISVNEDECYMWPECDSCGNGHLTSDSNADILTCPSCHCPVHSPITRIKMEVCVDCPELDTCQFHVQLQLHQSTVERLLPVTDSPEGYDISCVMNVAIGPLTCIIREKVTNQHEGTITVRLQEVRMIDS